LSPRPDPTIRNRINAATARVTYVVGLSRQ
jgi:hypothetical protein